MTISVGHRLPEATLLAMGADGPQPVALADRTRGRRVVIFGLPGAYTGTCSTAHVPSFIRTKDAFAAKGIDEIICVSVNDPFVMGAWGQTTGATAAGIAMLADADAAFTKAIGLNYSYVPDGLFDRSRRYALVAEDGVVTAMLVEEHTWLCDISAGEALLDAI